MNSEGECDLCVRAKHGGLDRGAVSNEGDMVEVAQQHCNVSLLNEIAFGNAQQPIHPILHLLTSS